MNHSSMQSDPVSIPQEEAPLLRADAEALYLLVGADGELRLGTCGHCVLEEGQPERATLPQGEQDLDFDRDGLLSLLQELGVHPVITHEYVCP